MKKNYWYFYYFFFQPIFDQKFIVAFPKIHNSSLVVVRNGLENDHTAARFIPEFVYRMTPTHPAFVFRNGFVRAGRPSLSLTRDLSEHLYSGVLNPNDSVLEVRTGQIRNPSAFISTFRSREYAVSYGIEFANPFSSTREYPWRTHSFYVYQIVPNHNFISVVDTYERELALAMRESDQSRFQNLLALDAFYTDEDEYAALNSIPTENIVSATLFYYDANTMSFVEGETRVNTHFNRNLVAEIHPNNYSIGNVPNASLLTNLISNTICEVHLQSIQQQASMRKKRSELICPPNKTKKANKIEMPKDIFDKNSLKIKVMAFNEFEYCLEPNDHYLYINYCKDTEYNNEWIYTEFGQMIAEVNDGHHNQYYCLSAPENNQPNAYLKMEICDLNKKEQIWKFNKSSNSKYTIVSHSGKTIGIKNNYYTYLIEDTNELKYRSVIVLNYSDVINKVSSPVIQFSVDDSIKIPPNKRHINFMSPVSSIMPKAPDAFYTIYPTRSGYAAVYETSNLNGYKNYYNAHNNSFFSNSGGSSKGQTCYYSSLVQEGGSSWGYVYNDYCSNQVEVQSFFKWKFMKNNMNESYHILDSGNNILHIAYYSRYGYTANPYWTDTDTFFMNFNLSSATKIYAINYTLAQQMKESQNVENKEFEKKFTFFSLYDYYENK